MVLGYLDDHDRHAVGVVDPHLVESPRHASGRVVDGNARGDDGEVTDVEVIDEEPQGEAGFEVW